MAFPAWLLSTRYSLTVLVLVLNGRHRVPGYSFFLFIQIRDISIPGTGRSLLSIESKSPPKPRIPWKIQKTDKRQGVLQPPNSGSKDQKTQVIFSCYLILRPLRFLVYHQTLSHLIMSASQHEAYDRGSPSRLVVMEDHPAYGIQVAPDHPQPQYVT
jgi:hypothetical protein